MQVLKENKVVCPKCNGAARTVPKGVFCATDGLTEDTSTYLRPTADPVSAALRADPQRLAAQVEMDTAQAAYEAASDAYFRVLSELQAVRLKARHDEGEFTGEHGWRPSRTVRALRRREEDLVEELDRVTRRRENAAEELTDARVHYQEVSAAVSGRLGRPVVTGNTRTRRGFIPVFEGAS